MKSLIVLALLVAVVSSASLNCDDSNCTEAVPVLSISFGSFFPVFSPISDNDKSEFDEPIDSLQTPLNSTEQSASPDVISIRFTEIIAFPDNENADNSDDTIFPGLQFIFDKNSMLADFGVLDLSGRNLTGDDVRELLEARKVTGQPVTSLVLSNSRVKNLNAGSLAPVESTLQELRMDNCSASLDALAGLSNLRLLNLSNTGLTTFHWFPLLSYSLEVLDLSHNQLSEVRPELSALTSLRRLYLSHNRISSVKEFPLVLLPNLEVLSLTMNSLNDATFTSLHNLQVLDLDWNYLWRCGYEARLPPHRMSVRLASNPWRCDCGLLYARDNYDVLDIDKLQCSNHGSFAICNDCARYFLPMENGRPVANLTNESIQHLGCTGLTDQLYLLRDAVVRLKQDEPEKLIRLGMMVVALIFFAIAACFICRHHCAQKKFDRQSWLKIQQIPYLKVEKLGKPQDIPYVKIDTPELKA